MKTVDRGTGAAMHDGSAPDPPQHACLNSAPRWASGGLLPCAYCANHIDEASALRVECLVEGDAEIAWSASPTAFPTEAGVIANGRMGNGRINAGVKVLGRKARVASESI